METEVVWGEANGGHGAGVGVRAGRCHGRAQAPPVGPWALGRSQGTCFHSPDSLEVLGPVFPRGPCVPQ